MTTRHPIDFIVPASPAETLRLLGERAPGGAYPTAGSEFHVSLDAPTDLHRLGAVARGRLEDRGDGTTRVVGMLAVSEAQSTWTLVLRVVALALIWALVSGNPAQWPLLAVTVAVGVIAVLPAPSVESRLHRWMTGLAGWEPRPCQCPPCCAAA